MLEHSWKRMWTRKGELKEYNGKLHPHFVVCATKWQIPSRDTEHPLGFSMSVALQQNPR